MLFSVWQDIGTRVLKKIHFRKSVIWQIIQIPIFIGVTINNFNKRKFIYGLINLETIDLFAEVRRDDSALYGARDFVIEFNLKRSCRFHQYVIH